MPILSSWLTIKKGVLPLEAIGIILFNTSMHLEPYERSFILTDDSFFFKKKEVVKVTF
jgi:hypothetical protein